MTERVRPRTERVRPTKPKKSRKEANRRHFTEDNVLTFKANKVKQFLIWDEGTDAARGLAILVSPTGTKSYRCVFYFPGSAKPQYMHIGRVGEMTLADARKRCRDARALAKQGIDPRANDPTKTDSFKVAVETFIKHEQIGRLKNKSAEKTQAVMLNDTKEWHERPIATIRYQEIEHLLWIVRDGDTDQELRPRPYLANRLFSHLKDFCGWCARRGTIKSSPMNDMEKPWNGAKSRERDWFKKTAADTAIRSLWNVSNNLKPSATLGADGTVRDEDRLSPNDKLSSDERRYLKLMMLTGKRKTALANMQWEEIDGDWFWDAPASDSKNKRLHGVPLSSLARNALHPRPPEGKGRVFGDINVDNLARKIRRVSGIADFFWHGLRHLAETKTAELRDEHGRPLILPHIRDLLFDHASKRGSGSGYDHHDYKPEMLTAMEDWAKYVDGLVTPQGSAGNITRLRC
jgi:integrase